MGPFFFFKGRRHILKESIHLYFSVPLAGGKQVAAAQAIKLHLSFQQFTSTTICLRVHLPLKCLCALSSKCDGFKYSYFWHIYFPFPRLTIRQLHLLWALMAVIYPTCPSRFYAKPIFLFLCMTPNNQEIPHTYEAQYLFLISSTSFYFFGLEFHLLWT